MLRKPGPASHSEGYASTRYVTATQHVSYTVNRTSVLSAGGAEAGRHAGDLHQRRCRSAEQACGVSGSLRTSIAEAAGTGAGSAGFSQNTLCS